jgi:hypothetical protein
VAKFWDLLRLFWDDVRIEKWHQAIFGTSTYERSPRDVCENMLSFNKQVHAVWSTARFALRPLEESEDKKTLKVQFQWQRRATDRLAEVDLLTEPQSTRDYHGEPQYALMVGSGARRQPSHTDASDVHIHSGDVFTLTTDDPERLPLPSWPLLEMQWILQRVAAMSGAAEPEDDECDESDNDGPRAVAVDRAACVWDVEK